VLHSGGRARKADAINNQSVVAVFEREGRRALLTGDAGASTERDLAGAGALAHADLLKVGHHGSRTSTTPLLLDVVRPRLALLSCGRENRFGHPAPATLRTLRAFGVPTFRTDRLSDVRVELIPGATLLSWRGVE
jgi:competence protein ComEC